MKNSFQTEAIVLFVCFAGFCVLFTNAADDLVAKMEKNEQEALYSSIQGFVGKWWNGSDLYPDPCGWTPIQGVSCDLFNGFWYVTSLSIGSIYGNSLQCIPTAEFKHQLFELKHLKTLSFTKCFMWPYTNQIIVPTNWENLANSLESLEFRSNPGLTGTIPTTFGHLKNLQSLVLLENGLNGTLPKEIGNLVSLKRLVLAGNFFEGQIPASFEQLSQLLILDFSRNNLLGSLHLTFNCLTSLIKLDLSNNFLEGILPREIGYLKNLTLLDLSHNKFSGGLVKSLQEMVALKVMVLSNNPIGGDLMGIQWKNFQNLEFLDLSNMGLKGNIPNSLTKLKRLRFIGLNNNCLSGNVPTSFEAMPNICSLYLYGNNFTGNLEFSGGFYGRLGSRFRASENPYICYKVELLSSSYGPSGVRPSEQKNTTYGKVLQ